MIILTPQLTSILRQNCHEWTNRFPKNVCALSNSTFLYNIICDFYKYIYHLCYINIILTRKFGHIKQRTIKRYKYSSLRKSEPLSWCSVGAQAFRRAPSLRHTRKSGYIAISKNISFLIGKVYALYKFIIHVGMIILIL